MIVCQDSSYFILMSIRRTRWRKLQLEHQKRRNEEYIWGEPGTVKDCSADSHYDLCKGILPQRASSLATDTIKCQQQLENNLVIYLFLHKNWYNSKQHSACAVIKNKKKLCDDRRGKKERIKKILMKKYKETRGAFVTHLCKCSKWCLIFLLMNQNFS